MNNTTLNVRIQSKYDTYENWTILNPILLQGEIIVYIQENQSFIKIGDGLTDFNNLPSLKINVNDLFQEDNSFLILGGGSSENLGTSPIAEEAKF